MVQKGAHLGFILVNFGVIFHQNVVLGRPCAPRRLQEGGGRRGKIDQKSSKKVPKGDKKAIKNAISMLFFLDF